MLIYVDFFDFIKENHHYISVQKAVIYNGILLSEENLRNSRSTLILLVAVFARNWQMLYFDTNLW